MAEWDVEVGAVLNRDERVARFGGGKYGGIEPSAQTPNVFVYSDPTRGGAYGYDFDGWAGGEFLYTGEGRVGDQELREGNRAILEHAEQGRALRLFVADGHVGDTKTRRNLYVGEFEVNKDVPFFSTEAPDQRGNLRTVLVFRLRPVGEHLRRAEDESESGLPAAEEAAEDVSLEHDEHESDVEAATPSSFERKRIDSTEATRRESQLVGRYRAHLEAQGHTVKARRIRPPGEFHWLRVDLIDVTADELYEAKGTTTRDSVRLAIGQLYDYNRFVEASRRSVLLPTRPGDDLLALIADRGMSCVFECRPGEFERIDPPA